MMPDKKKKIIVVSGGSDVPPELLKAIAEQSMSDGMGESPEEGEEEEAGEEMDEAEDGDDPLEKELMSVVKRIVESCQ